MIRRLAGARAAEAAVRSPTARLSALALAAIVAPAAIVAVLGYLSLRQWQTSAELLFREQARDVAAMAAREGRDDAAPRRGRRSSTGCRPRLAAGDVDAAGARPPRGRARRWCAASTWSGATARCSIRRAWRDAADAAPVRAGAARRCRAAAWERGGKRDVVAGDQVCLAVRCGRRAASRCWSPTRATSRRCAATFSRRRWPGSSRRRSWPCSTRTGRPVYSRAPLDRAERGAGGGRRARRCRTGAWRSTRRRARRPRDVVRRQVMLFTGAFGVLLAVIVAGVRAHAGGSCAARRRWPGSNPTSSPTCPTI